MAKKKNSDFVDFKGLLQQYLSKWYLFVICVAVCVGLAFFYVKVRKQNYSVRANVLISQEDNARTGAAMSSELGDIGALFGSQGYVEDEIFIVSSHSLYRNVARDLGINVAHYVREGFMDTRFAYPDYPVDVKGTRGLADTLRNTVVFKIKVDKNGKAQIEAKAKGKKIAKVKDVTLPYALETPMGLFTVTPTPHFEKGKALTTRVVYSSYDSAAEDLDDDVMDEIASKRSNVISMNIQTPVPEYGKDILNEIVKKYNERGVDEKRLQNEITADFIDVRLDLLSKELGELEHQMQVYKQNHGIVSIEIDAKYQIEKKARIEAELIEARTEEEAVQMTLDFIRDPANAYSLAPLATDNEGLWKAIESYNTLVLQRMEIANSAHGDNTALQLMSKQIDAMRVNIINSTERALVTAKIASDELQRELNSSQSGLEDIPLQEREYINLERQQQVKQQLYLFLLQRREETAMMIANAFPKGIIVDEAYTMSEPLGMGGKAILLLAFMFGMCITPAILYLRRLYNNRFETVGDVQRITDVPILGEMCTDSSGNRLVAVKGNTSSSAELFRLMRTQLLFILNDQNDKVVLMTSSTSGEGKSFISINLAASLALMDKKVLLVGMDIRNPQLSNYLGIHPKFGLTQYLASSDISLGEIINPLPGATGLDVITAGPVPPNPAELLISHKVDELFVKLRDMYDYIIVDTAPIGLVSDTFTLDRIADAAIYVCRANYTSLRDLTLVNDIYEQHRLKKLSIVVNGTAAKKQYGYGNKKK